MTDQGSNPFEPPFDPNYNPYYPPLAGTGQPALPTAADPYLSGASRFLPQQEFDAFQDPQRGFVPNYSHFYNPQNFLEQTPQPTFAAPFYHSGPPSANPAPPLLPGDSQFPYPMEQPVGEIPTEVSPVEASPAQQADQAGRWVQSQTGKLFWLGPQGRRWEGPEMNTARPGWQVDPSTGAGVNALGDPINISGGQVVPNQPSQANSWAKSTANNPFFIGPSGYKWEGPQMLNQLGVNDTGTWRIDPTTGYGVDANGQRILVKNGQVTRVG